MPPKCDEWAGYVRQHFTDHGILWIDGTRIFGPLPKADEWHLSDSPESRIKMGNMMFQLLHVLEFLPAGRLVGKHYGVISDAYPHPNSSGTMPPFCKPTGNFRRASAEEAWESFRKHQEEQQRIINENAERIRQEHTRVSNLQQAVNAAGMATAEANLRATQAAAAQTAARIEQLNRELWESSSSEVAPRSESTTAPGT